MSTSNYVVTSTLPPKFGGRTNALLQRTKLLMNKFGVSFTLISTNHHQNYDLIYESYIEKGYVPEETKFLNIYDFFSGRDYRYRKPKKHPHIIKKHEVQEVKKGQVYRYFKNGDYVRYRKYDKETGVLLFEDHMDIYARKRMERYEYNRFGYLFRKIIYKRNTLRILEEIFYDDKERAYLIKSYADTPERELKRIILFHNGKIREFKEESDFFQHGFNLMLPNGASVFCDARLLDKALLKCKSKVKKNFILHSAHSLRGKRRDSFCYLMDHHEKANSIVALTAEQQADLEAEGLDPEKIVVIPHAMKEEKYMVKPASERNKEIVFIGRLSAEKQINHIIEAFSLIANTHSEWSLSIYGEGDQEKTLAELIQTKELEDRVYLKGFTTEGQAIFENAAFSVMTSKFEGFGMVIMESLHNGCPVLSYNFKYGPRDLIQDNVNGRIVEKNNIQALAEAMDQMISSPLENVRLAAEFYENETSVKWKKLVK